MREPTINPYAEVDWDKAHQVHSLSHFHVYWGDAAEMRKLFQKFYDMGIRHFPISNYYPSAPTYPLGDHFADLPDDVIGGSNAEHHSMTDTPLHFNSLGSTFRSGKPQGQNPRGLRKPWRAGFDAALAQLQYEDGGGITINHPAWSKLTVEQVIQMFDHDPRVLGIEVYNDVCEKATTTPHLGWSDDYWQTMLSTGRHVLGFFTVDHAVDDDPLGRNILLLPEVTEHEAMRAYRRGNFYGSLRGSARFTHIAVDLPFIGVATDRGQAIRFITQDGVVQESQGVEARYRLTGKEVFVRIEVDAPEGEKLFSQPIMFVTPP